MAVACAGPNLSRRRRHPSQIAQSNQQKMKINCEMAWRFEEKLNLLCLKSWPCLKQPISMIQWPQKTNCEITQSIVLQSVWKFRPSWGVATIARRILNAPLSSHSVHRLGFDPRILKKLTVNCSKHMDISTAYRWISQFNLNTILSYLFGQISNVERNQLTFVDLRALWKYLSP
jgi:hypothetical protein